MNITRDMKTKYSDGLKYAERGFMNEI